MARVTVEDCIPKVSSKFELVLLTAQLAKDINSGMPLPIDRNNDKDSVLALRLLAGGYAQVEALRIKLIKRLSANSKVDKVDDANLHAVMEDLMDHLDEPYVSDEHPDLDEDHLDIDNDKFFGDGEIDEKIP